MSLGEARSFLHIAKVWAESGAGHIFVIHQNGRRKRPKEKQACICAPGQIERSSQTKHKSYNAYDAADNTGHRAQCPQNERNIDDLRHQSHNAEDKRYKTGENRQKQSLQRMCPSSLFIPKDCCASQNGHTNGGPHGREQERQDGEQFSIYFDFHNFFSFRRFY